MELEAAKTLRRDGAVPTKRLNRKNFCEAMKIADVIFIVVADDEFLYGGTADLAEIYRGLEADLIIMTTVKQRDIPVVGNEQGTEAVTDVEDTELHLGLPFQVVAGFQKPLGVGICRNAD